VDHIVCPRCGNDVVPREPERGGWKVLVTFWVFTLLFGIAAYAWPWTFIFLLAWLALAILAIQFGLRAAAWTCPRCDAIVAAPHEAVV
jgi:hypothetical protein